MAKKKRCLLLRRHLFFFEWNIDFLIFSIVTFIVLNYNIIDFFIGIYLLHPINASLSMYINAFVRMKFHDFLERIVFRMLFTDLDRPLQRGFLVDLRRIVRMLLQDMDYVIVEEDVSFITGAFVEQVIIYLEKTRFFQKWIEVDVSAVDLKELLQQIELSMRKRRSTLRQRNYFANLLYAVDLREDIPTDYLCMKKRVLELEHLKEQQKHTQSLIPVPIQQITLLKKAWKETMGRKLEVSEDIKQNEVDELFSRINRKRCKRQRQRQERYSCQNIKIRVKNLS